MTMIDKGVQALSTVAHIDGRGSTPLGEMVIFRLHSDKNDDDARASLDGLSLKADFGQEGQRQYVVLTEIEQPQSTEVPRIHKILFFATILTTLAAGAILAGHNIYDQPWLMLKGWPFSLTLMAILGTHEAGHYIYARKHHVDVTLPYFIPVPPPITFIGTFGAFIKIKGSIPNRLALLEIGAAGPIAGFIVAVPALLLGLNLSTVVDLPEEAFFLGDSLLMKLLTMVVFPGLGAEQDIMLHPVAFAGWIGLLVTMLNLLPLAQLDGGHIAYALLGDRQALLGKAIMIALIPMGLFLSPQWLFWGILIIVLMRTVSHPPVHDINRPLTLHEKRIGMICLIIFILCFIPVPFSATG